jgi:dTDP-D-glucose 4,6-dehydratase
MIEDNYLALDSRKARAELNWKNLLNSDEAIEATIKWWKEFLKGESPRMLVEEDIRKYLFSDM